MRQKITLSLESPSRTGSLRWPHWFVIGALFLSLLAVWGGFNGSDGTFAWRTVRFFMDILHLLVVGLCTFGTLLICQQPGGRVVSPSKRAIAAAHQFETYWRFLWVSWAALYLFFVALGGIEIYLDKVARNEHLALLTAVGRGCSLLANNFQSVAMFGLWWELMGRTFSKEGDEFKHANPVLSVGVVLTLFTSFAHLGVLVLSQYERYSWAVPLANLFDSGSGVLAATSFGLFFARLESRYLGISISRLVAFYFYAGLQPLFPLFRSPQFLALTGDQSAAVLCALKTFALLLKIAMFVVVRNLLINGRILFYMQSIETNLTSVSSQFLAFLKPAEAVSAVDTGR